MTYSDADVETYAERLGSADGAVRALAADEVTDGVSDWGQHSSTPTQARRMATVLVDALEVEADENARESIVNALATLVVWDLAPISEVSRAIALPRPGRDPASGHWSAIEEWAGRNGG